MPTDYRTILLVEDEETDALLIESAFRLNGVRSPIHVVGTGSQAIAYLMGEGKYSNRMKFAFPTFIITDLKMPAEDGLEVLHHLKSNPEWATIPTVVLSSSDDPDDIKKAYMLGAGSFHRKPNSYEALRQQLKVLYEYWMTCCVPEVDVTGRLLMTDSRGKLGERFPQPSGGIQTRHPSRRPQP